MGTFSGPVTDGYGNERVGFDLETVVNRHDFGISWNVAIETGGVMLSEDVDVEIEISAIKQA